jgi:hypothetical protein
MRALAAVLLLIVLVSTCYCQDVVHEDYVYEDSSLEAAAVNNATACKNAYIARKTGAGCRE